eukprot:364693-Chlamydomonas_euryale.AAC.8
MGLKPDMLGRPPRMCPHRRRADRGKREDGLARSSPGLYGVERRHAFHPPHVLVRIDSGGGRVKQPKVLARHGGANGREHQSLGIAAPKGMQAPSVRELQAVRQQPTPTGEAANFD